MTTTHEHADRLNVYKQVPGYYEALIAIDKIARTGLDPILTELVVTRASQINHCAFCLDLHTKASLAAGEDPRRLHVLAAWDEAGDLFTPAERAALALTEAVTVLTNGFVPDDVYDAAAAQFDPATLARLITLIVTINSWNRVAVTTRRTPPKH